MEATILRVPAANTRYYYEWPGAYVIVILQLTERYYEFMKALIKMFIENYRNLNLMQDYKELFFLSELHFH